MAKVWPRFTAALALVLCLAATPGAAESGTTVKVALLDMSSVMGPGMAGYGMMGPGPGTMGGGMMGGGMMGPATMGLGMMSMRTDLPSIKEGKVHFEVTNWSRSIVHEVLVVATDNPNAALPYNYAEAKVAEDQVKILGEVADLQPNASGTMDLDLAPGWFLLVCNVPGHYAAGMVAPIHVGP